MVDHARQIRIGECFPADDPVAVFVTTVAMISNDLLRLVDWMLRSDWTDEGAAADRLFSLRVQAAALCEASKYFRETPPRWPEIDAFVNDLGPEAAAELARVQAAGDPHAVGYLGDWLTGHRNLTFHYAEMHPERVRRGLHAVARALADMAEIDTPLGGGGRIGDVRYSFADSVAIQWLPDDPIRKSMPSATSLWTSPGSLSVPSLLISRRDSHPPSAPLATKSAVQPAVALGNPPSASVDVPNRLLRTCYVESRLGMGVGPAAQLKLNPDEGLLRLKCRSVPRVVLKTRGSQTSRHPPRPLKSGHARYRA